MALTAGHILITTRRDEKPVIRSVEAECVQAGSHNVLKEFFQAMTAVVFVRFFYISD